MLPVIPTLIVLLLILLLIFLYLHFYWYFYTDISTDTCILTFYFYVYTFLLIITSTDFCPIVPRLTEQLQCLYFHSYILPHLPSTSTRFYYKFFFRSILKVKRSPCVHSWLERRPNRCEHVMVKDRIKRLTLDWSWKIFERNVPLTFQPIIKLINHHRHEVVKMEANYHTVTSEHSTT